jgi:Cu/Ag efflux pump CusA
MLPSSVLLLILILLIDVTFSTAGMLPLALAIGAGSEMLQPLAIVVIGVFLVLWGFH